MLHFDSSSEVQYVLCHFASLVCVLPLRQVIFILIVGCFFPTFWRYLWVRRIFISPVNACSYIFFSSFCSILRLNVKSPVFGYWFRIENKRIWSIEMLYRIILWWLIYLTTIVYITIGLWWWVLFKTSCFLDYIDNGDIMIYCSFWCSSYRDRNLCFFLRIILCTSG